MYSIDGELTISRHPEALIGQYGLHHVSHQDSLQSGYLLKTTVKHDVLGSESGVQQAAARLRQQGLIPEDLQVEHITSLEQAQKYPPVTGRTIEIVSFRKPDLGEVLSQMQIPEGEKLLEGFARLWRETHYPSPAVYFLAVGHLLETM